MLEAPAASPFAPALKDAFENNPRYASLMPWIARLRFEFLDKQTLQVSFPITSLSDLFTSSLRSLFKEAIEVYQPEIINIQYPDHLAGPLPGLPEFTFDSYVKGNSNQLALTASKRFADPKTALSQSLYVHGQTGLGKTHLLQSIYATSLLHTAPETICSVDLGLLSDPNQKQNLCSRIQNDINLLLIDNFHRIPETIQYDFLHILDTIWQQGKRIACFSSKSPQAMPHLIPEIVSRLHWGLVLEITTPDSTMRKQYIQQRLVTMNFNLPTALILFLANHTHGPLRELDGILTEIQTRTHLLDEKPDLQLLYNILQIKKPGNSQPVVTLTAISTVVCHHFKISLDDLRSRKRTRSISYPRQIAMYLAQTLTSSSLEEIGFYFGGRDHSTIKHGYDKIKRKLELEKDQSTITILANMNNIIHKDCS